MAGNLFESTDGKKARWNERRHSALNMVGQSVVKRAITIETKYNVLEKGAEALATATMIEVWHARTVVLELTPPPQPLRIECD